MNVRKLLKKFPSRPRRLDHGNGEAKYQVQPNGKSRVDSTAAEEPNQCLPGQNGANEEDDLGAIPASQDNGLGVTTTAVSDSVVGNSSLLPTPAEPVSSLGRAKLRLLDASSKLDETLDDYARAFKDGPNFNDSGIRSVVAAATSSAPLADLGDEFGRALERLATARLTRKTGWAMKLAGYMGKIYPLVALAMGIGSAVAEGANFLPVKGAVNAVSLLLQLAMEEQGRYEDFIKQLDRVSFQAHRIAELQSLPGILIRDLVIEKATDLLIAILDYLRLTLIYFKHDYFYNLGKTLLLGPQIYSEAKASLECAISEYDQALLLQIATTVITSSTSSQIAPSSDSTDEIFSWLRPSKHETESQLAKNTQLRAPGTLQWLLSLPEFLQWRLSGYGQQSSVLWLSGLPGIGKTVISAYLVEMLRAQYPNATVLYFFVKAGEPGLHTTSDIACTLACQLMQTHEQARTHLLGLKAQQFSPTGKDSAQLVNKLLHNPLTSLKNPVFIVLDGLDECSGDESYSADSVEEFLSAMSRLDCHLLIASRPTDSLTYKLRDHPTKQLTFDDSRGDIELYVKYRVEHSRQLRNGFGKVELDPVEYMVSRSKGNFLWVTIVLKLLERAFSANTFKNTLDTLPPQLGSLYDAIFQKLEGSGNLELALRIIEWTVFSRQQLTLDELQVALEKGLGDEIIDLAGFIEAHCGTFLIIAPHGSNDRAVHIGHETFHAYITNDKLCKYLHPSAAEARLAKVCLDACCEKEESGRLRDYAVANWLVHFEAAGFQDAMVSQTGESVERFLRGEGLRTWTTDTMRRSGSQYRERKAWAQILRLYNVLIDWNGKTVAAGEKGLIEKLFENHTAFEASLCELVSNVWLGNIWKSWTAAHDAYFTALKVGRALNQIPKFDTPPATIHRGTLMNDYWDWRKVLPNYPSDWGQLRSNIDYNVSPEEVQLLLMLGSYNPSTKGHPFNAAIAHIHNGIVESMEKLFVLAYDEDPECAIYCEGLGTLYNHDYFPDYKDDQKALEFYGKALSLDTCPLPESAEKYHRLLAKVQERNGDIEGARRSLREAAYKYLAVPNGYLFWNLAAATFEKRDDWDGAKKVYREALEADPSGALYLYPEIAKMELNQGNWRQAVEVYLDAIETDPSNWNNYRSGVFTRAENLMGCQRWEDACEVLDMAKSRDKGFLAAYPNLELDIYLAWGKFGKAVKALQIVSESSTEQSPFLSWEEMGDCYLALGEFDRSIAAYKQGFSPDDPVRHQPWLGRAYSITGRHDLAIREFKHAIHADEISKEQWGDQYLVEGGHYLWLAEAYEAQNRKDDAKSAYISAKSVLESIIAHHRRMAEISTTVWRSDARNYVLLATTLEKLGEIDSAKQRLTKAVEMFERTTYLEDDEMEQSELADAIDHLARLSADPIIPRQALAEDQVMFRLRRDLVFKRHRRTNWASTNIGSCRESGLEVYR